MNKLLHWAFPYLAGALIAIGVGCWWYFSQTPAAPVGQWVQPRVAPPVAKVQQVLVTCPKTGIHVLADPAKRTLDLAPDIQANPHKHAAAAILIPADDRPVTAMALYDDQAGQIDMMYRREPYPFLAAEDKAYIGFLYGYKGNAKNGFTGNVRAGRLEFGGDLLQIKSVHLGGQVSIDTDGEHDEWLTAIFWF